ncbi:MAG: hypothetical protein ACLR6I_19820 [Waltera sp.]
MPWQLQESSRYRYYGSEAGVLKFAENGLLADISSMYGEGDAKPLDALTFKYQGTSCCLFQQQTR